MIVLVEGDTDLPLVRKLAADAKIAIRLEQDCGGKSQLDQILSNYNAMAKGAPCLVLRDLDADAVCASEFIGARRFRPEKWMVFRLAIRASEAWLMADAQALATFLRVSMAKIPSEPDAVEDPKQMLVNLARHSSDRKIREAMAPAPNDFRRVGPLYESMIIEFAERHWTLGNAVSRSPSLERARNAVRALSVAWSKHCRGEST